MFKTIIQMIAILLVCYIIGLAQDSYVRKSCSDGKVMETAFGFAHGCIR